MTTDPDTAPDTDPVFETADTRTDEDPRVENVDRGVEFPETITVQDTDLVPETADTRLLSRTRCLETLKLLFL